MVHTWDMRSQRCLRRDVDEGCIRGAALACSDTYYASGSDAGVVNLHARPAGERRRFRKPREVPLCWVPPSLSLWQTSSKCS